jgi:pyruvate dehydrogenase E2 component (dihydrolipoamide acetyltransferase)
MVHVIKMPRLSDTMEIGKLIKWYKNVGDNVNEGDIIADIETDKAIQEFEIDVDGFLLYQGIKPGDNAKVDDIIAIIGDNPKEKIDQYINNEAKNDKISSKDVIVINKQDKEDIIPDKKIIKASPLAKKIAQINNINLSDLKYIKNKTRITKDDVQSHIKNIQASRYDNKDLNIVNNDNVSDTTVLNSSMRNIIAEKLSISKFSAPHYYLTINVNMDNCKKFKDYINENSKLLNIDYNISYNDIIVKATSLSLRNNMLLNASWNKNSIIHHTNINIGVAVAIEEGLLVPVIFNADKQSLGFISQDIKNKIIKAKSRKISSIELENSTFTISNLGMFDIESFTSIINQPNSCILSVGSIVEKPIVKNLNIVVGLQMKLTMACDHRVVDGVIGSKFLKTLKILLENPTLMFI